MRRGSLAAAMGRAFWTTLSSQARRDGHDVGALRLEPRLWLAAGGRQPRRQLLDRQVEPYSALLQPRVVARQDRASGAVGELVVVVPERVEELVHLLARLGAEALGQRRGVRRLGPPRPRERLRPRDARRHREELVRDVDQAEEEGLLSLGRGAE